MKSLGLYFGQKKHAVKGLLISLFGAVICLYFLGFYQFPRVLSALQLRGWVGEEKTVTALIVDKQIRKKLVGDERKVEYILLYLNPENLGEPKTIQFEKEEEWKAFSTGDSLVLIRTALGDFPKIFSFNSLGGASQLALDIFASLVELGASIIFLYLSLIAMKSLKGY
ncbi:MAG: hypothetical protein SFU91_01165 [Chloroherpetonaceae bacterium]|nr:hypothetical protein [Chloroherpetonaceae bacterium]